MKKIIIELDGDLNIKAEGIENPIEAIGILDYARHVYINCVNEDSGDTQGMTEQ